MAKEILKSLLTGLTRNIAQIWGREGADRQYMFAEVTLPQTQVEEFQPDVFSNVLGRLPVEVQRREAPSGKGGWHQGTPALHMIWPLQPLLKTFQLFEVQLERPMLPSNLREWH